MASCSHGNFLRESSQQSRYYETYNAQFQDLVDRNCIELVSPQEIEEWESTGGKVSYISHLPVLVPDYTKYTLSPGNKLVFKDFWL